MTATNRLGVVLLTASLILGALTLLLPASSGESQAFLPSVRVDGGPNGEASLPSCVALNNSAWVFWQDGRNGDFDIWCANSTDGGQTFFTPVRVDDTDRNSNPGDGGSEQKNPCAVIDDLGNLYVAWEDNRNGDWDIYFSKSADLGGTWSTNIRVDDGGTYGQHHPRMTLDDSDTLFVVWDDERGSSVQTQTNIYFIKSSDRGQNFDVPSIQVDDAGPGVLNQKFPDVAVDQEGNIYVAWEDDRVGDMDIYSSVSTDGGLSFETNVLVSDDAQDFMQSAPRMVAIGSKPYVVWSDGRNANNDIYYSYSNDYGLTYAANARIDHAAGSVDAMNPDVAVGSDNTMYVFWTDNRNSSQDIFMSWSHDLTTFFPDQQASDPGLLTVQSFPSVAIDKYGKLYCAYQDNRNGDYDIYVATSISGGMPGAAPSLSLGWVNPTIGDSDQQFFFRITYTDPDNDPPALGYPKVFIEYDKGKWEAYPASPFNMTHQTYPLQDYQYTNGEIYNLGIVLNKEYKYRYYFEGKAIKGNTTIVRSEQYYGPVVDTTPVAFGNFSPSSSKWQGSIVVPCRIEVRDINGSGVDGSTVQYAISTEGPEDGKFSRWYSSTSSDDNETVIFEKNITFVNGTQNNIKFRAKDVMENGFDADGYQESEIYQIKIDTEAPHYSYEYPTSVMVFDSHKDRQCTIEVDDRGGVGINFSSVRYAVKTTDQASFGIWYDVSASNITELEANNQSIKCQIVTDLANGTENYIMWKAADLLGNVLQSKAYRVIVDEVVLPPDNYPPSPPTLLMPSAVNDLAPHLHWLGASDKDGDTLYYYVQMGAASGQGNVLPWTFTGANAFYDAPASLNLTYGKYYVQIKSNDTKLNSTVFESVVELSLTANHPPSPPNSISPNITGNRMPRINWTGATDADNDTLIYYLQVGKTPWGNETLSWSSTGTKTHYDIITYLPATVYYIQVQACDGRSFSRIFQSTMEVGYFSLDVSVYDKITVLSGKSTSTIINVTNKGAKQDDITISLQGAVLSDKNVTVTLEKTLVTLDPDQYTSVKLEVSAVANATSETYNITIVVTSKDGSTRDMVETNIIVYNPTPPDDDTDDDVDPPDDDVNPDDDVDSQVYKYGFYIFALIIVIVVAVVTYIARMWYLKRQENEEDFNKPVEDHKYEDKKEDLDGKMDDEFDEVDVTEDEAPTPKGKRPR